MRPERCLNCSRSSIPDKVSGTNMAACTCTSSSDSFILGAMGVCWFSSKSLETLIRPSTSSKDPRHTGYHEWASRSWAWATWSRHCCKVRLTSNQAMSLRGTIKEVSGRSSSRNTFCTIWCSCCSITPASTPSSRLARISSAVMLRSTLLGKPIKRNTHWVVVDSSNTKGRATKAVHCMGRDTQRATSSGYICPMRLGTSSPKIMVRKVIKVTTKAVAVMAATDSDQPQSISQCAKPALKAASPTMPLSTPIDVMPT